MRDELLSQSRQAKLDREESERQNKADQKQREVLRREFRTAVYSQLELTDETVAALEWLRERPNHLDYWEYYETLPRRHPIAIGFVSSLNQAGFHGRAEHDKDIVDWLKSKVFPGDRFEGFLAELPLLCDDHRIWEERFKIVYEVEEKRRKKWFRFWLSVLALVVLGALGMFATQ